MNVLQISCGVSYSKVYYNLFLQLKNKGINFKVYIPQHDNNTVPMISEKEFPFSFYSNKVIKPYDKFIYFSKIKRMVKDVQRNLKLSEVSLSHAHSLFSDGAVAYEIQKKHNIPYIVAVRDTDVNQYYRKAIHLRRYALNILKNSQSIIFLSKSYRDNVLNNYIPEKYRKEIMNKTKIIPNGIDNYWLSNRGKASTVQNNKKIKLLYVGQITRRKNIESIIKASKLFEKKYGQNVSLVVVGKVQDENYFNKLRQIGSFEYIPYLPKEKLINIYRESDVFVMPSTTETFGLVYAEAMSQGVPIIYTRGQGFDTQFSEGEVGYNVDSSSSLEIAQKIKKIMDNRKEISLNCIRNVEKFNWSLIGDKYNNLYTDLSQKN